MDSVAIRHPQSAGNPRRLSGLYSHGKAASPPTSADDSPEILSLHRKYRIQRDRLIAWGLEWNDGENQQVNIDDSIERAGLTEVVLSVMENIKLMLDEVDNIRLEDVTGTYPHEKTTTKESKTGPWTGEEKEQYHDLIKDFTSSIDLLCDLKARKQPPAFTISNKAEKDVEYFDRKTSRLSRPQSNKVGISDVITRDVTIYQDLDLGQIPLLDYSSLRLPKESPPSYDETGTPRPSRDFAELLLSSRSDKDGDGTVLVEYVNFDRIYQANNMPLPMDRLQELFTCLKTIARYQTQHVMPTLTGYFEDPHHPRYGLVFELPPHASYALSSSRLLYHRLSPITLLDMLQRGSRLQADPATSTAAFAPPLEQRFKLANQLVCGLCTLGDYGLTHQALNSHSIVLLPKVFRQSQSKTSADQYDSLEPLIGGFDLFSQYGSDQAPPLVSQTIYRHPADPKGFGDTSTHDARPLHDLYSLGLILLEIGLWTPVGDIFKDKYTLQDFRTRVEKIWVPRLAGKCGTAYMEAVRDCLDADNRTDGSPEMLQQTWSRVKTRLARCCSLAEPKQDEFNEDSLVSLRTANLGSQAVRQPGPNPGKLNFEATMIAVPSLPVAVRPRSNMKRKLTGPAPPRMFLDLPIPEQVLDQWENVLMYRVGKVVDKELNGLPGKLATCSVSLDMCGETRDVAKPTILVSVSRAWDLVEARLRKSFGPEQVTYDFTVFSGPIVRAKTEIERTAGRGTQEAQNACHQERPVCGASIGAFVDDEHSPPVTFGGVVVVDGEVFGLTVHHMLEMPDIESDDDLESEEGKHEDADNTVEDDNGIVKPRITRSSCPPQLHRNVLATSPAHDLDSSLQSESDTPSTGADSEDDEEDEELEHVGDTPGIFPKTSPHIIVTQPALLDVPSDFFPIPDDKNEDHVDSHTLGHVYASSGLRRADHTLNFITAKVEIDWALIKLNPSRLQPANVIAGGKTHCSHASDAAYQPRLHSPVFRNEHKAAQDVYPRFLASSTALTGLSVHSIGRTTGLTVGVVRSLGLVRFPNRRTSSRVWVVRGGMGSPGDSGAWVIDNASRHLCGHILAWSEMASAAFMAPMDLTLNDVKKTLGAGSVRLPGALPWEGVSRLAAAVLEGDRTGASTSTSSSSSVNAIKSALENVKISRKSVPLKRIDESPSPLAGSTDIVTVSGIRRRIAGIDADTRAQSISRTSSSARSKTAYRPLVMRERRLDGERLAMPKVAGCIN